ncbi:IS66-like element accessory protein TnpA [Roseovarius spongiae]|uniref:IS66-like element accessory protein TnpA n=1 Tax=Roseovarius spongiae TaxID=2320272 RepID=UPI0024824883|nr:transposase [Roseovarius spongiae]
MEDTLEFFRSGGARSSASSRRRWPDALKGQIVAETLEPGATVRGVAERYGLRANRLSEWRRLAKDGKLVLPADEQSGDEAMFAPLVVCDAEAPTPEAEGSAAGRDVRIAVGDVVIELDADTPAKRIAELVRAIGARA